MTVFDAEALAEQSARPAGRTVLVTGGTGFLGKVLVRRLVAEGHRVRVLARTPIKVNVARELGADAVLGDVADIESFGQAMVGCDTVLHLAAGTSGSVEDSQTATLRGTRNLLNLCRRYRPRRLVYISSCSVYGVADYDTNSRVTETSSLERFPDRRGSYSASKLEAEAYVWDFIKTSDVPTVILRPGAIYGPGGELYTPLIGFSVASTYIVIGTGDAVLPFVYVDNLVDAILLSMKKDEAVGQVFNVVDTERLDKRTYMNCVIRRTHPGARVVYVPYSLIYSVTWLQERVFGLMKRRPVLSCYRLTSSQKSVLYDSSRIADHLGWRANVSITDAMERLVQSEDARRGSSVMGVQASTSEVVRPVDGQPGSVR